MFYDPANPKNRYWTISATDSAIPAGYLNSGGSDGAIPEALKTIAGPGLASGGYPKYGDLTTNPTWPNGILGGYGGGKATG